jgi:hypothetical protein
VRETQAVTRRRGVGMPQDVDDIEQLCAYLVELQAAIDSQYPRVPQRYRDAMRHALDTLIRAHATRMRAEAQLRSLEDEANKR